MLKNPPAIQETRARSLEIWRSGEGRSPGEGNGYLMYSCLANSMVRGAWQNIVYGVTEEPGRLSVHAVTESDTFLKCVCS